ncbi:MAG: response regulator transcription factor [Puniceicoccaceae bacterium]
MPISLFLIEDEELVCELLAEFLSAEEDINFLGDARDGASAIEKCRELKPEMLILDLRLPEVSGIDVLKVLHKELPETKVIIFTGSLSEDILHTTLKNGAIAYVEKAYGLDELQKAIAAAKEGKQYFSPSIARLVEDYQF